MIRRRLRRLFRWRTLATLTLLALLGFGAAVLILRSAWFRNQVRQRMVLAVEEATGGRVEIGSFDFNWEHMRVEVRGFVIHGLEPAGKPPLFRAESVAVGLKIVSLIDRQADIKYLEVGAPHLFLSIAPDGSTNIPEPKVHRKSAPGMETVLKLAIGRFDLTGGEIEAERHGKLPFDIHGKQLQSKLTYERKGPRYRGEISMQPLDVLWNKGDHVPFDIRAAFTLEKNRIGIDSLRVATPATTVNASGAVENLADPHTHLRYDARLAIADGARFLGIKGLSGLAVVRGNMQFGGPAGFSLGGDLHATGVEFRTGSVRLEGFRLDGKVVADDVAVRLRGLRIAGDVAGLFLNPVLLDGEMGEMALVGDDLEMNAMALGLLGGVFHGDAKMFNFERFRAQGEVAGVSARQAIGLDTVAHLPWDALGSGPVSGEGSLTHVGGMRAHWDLALTPAPDSAPMDGHMAATYDSIAGTIDVGRSVLRLPHSRGRFTGIIGQQMLAHVESRDLGDLLPAFGTAAAALPLKLDGGSAVFDGSLTGPFSEVLVQGHLISTRVSYQGELAESLGFDVVVNAARATVRNLVATRGPTRLTGGIAVDLDDWETEPGSLVFGSLILAGGRLAEIAPLVGMGAEPVSGTLDGTVAIAGTAGNPLVDTDLNLRQAVLWGEPVDSLAAHLRYTVRRLEATSAQFTAGAKQVSLWAAFDHPEDHWDTGRVAFRGSGNAMPLEQIHTLAEARPGIEGTAELSASGIVDLAPGKVEHGWRLRELHLDAAGHGLRLAQQPFGDLHLTANSEGATLRAHIESAFAGSSIRGDGQWRLDGDYPGTAAVAFSKLDFVKLRNWVAPAEGGAPGDLRGSAEGELRIDGPALQPRLVKTELRIPALTISPTEDAAGGTAAAADALTLSNSGPIVVSMLNSVVTVESARLVGRATDVSITGKAQLNARDPLNLRVKGRLDMAMVRELNPDFEASGAVTADASVRGALDAPIITGRIGFQNAAFNIVDVPNGISNANGEIDFAGGRATIRSFTGETGGGRIELSGFVSAADGQTSFRLAARVREVRIRYPEGVSTVADANLSLTGTPERSMLSGTVTIQRTGFNPQSDFSSLIAQSSQPVETPPARTGFLGGLHFDVQVNSATDLQFQSSLAQDLQAEANLQVRGTFSNPAVLGRISVTRGQIVFFGTKYAISQGSVQFLNPLRIEPVLDVALETKARGVEVTLTVSGPLNHLSLVPSSDPPLAFSEIVALLATGRAPTGDPAMISQQNTAPQSWQQTGASALLGQAIASPVTGRLQRFFGVSNLRIDPTISGVENNPLARITVEQQVTRDITFTYITDVTRSNPQVVRVEWSLGRNWSAVALREENGMFGLDFYYKKRFK